MHAWQSRQGGAVDVRSGVAVHEQRFFRGDVVTKWEMKKRKKKASRDETAGRVNDVK
jgi:hypothetical protein